MYFWRIDALTAQMRHGPLPQANALRYLLANSLVLAALSGVPGLWNAPTEPVHVSEWVGYWVSLVLLCVGTVVAYHANGGRGGVDFVARFLALSWVLGIRLLVLVFLPALVGIFMVGVVLAATVTMDDPDAGAIPVGVIVGLGIAFEVMWYWRITHQLRIVARRADGTELGSV